MSNAAASRNKSIIIIFALIKRQEISFWLLFHRPSFLPMIKSSRWISAPISSGAPSPQRLLYPDLRIPIASSISGSDRPRPAPFLSVSPRLPLSALLRHRRCSSPSANDVCHPLGVCPSADQALEISLPLVHWPPAKYGQRKEAGPGYTIQSHTELILKV